VVRSSGFEVFGQPVGPVLSIPGGLFEVGLGLLLVVRGSPQQATVSSRA
jgi:hypothetical protein